MPLTKIQSLGITDGTIVNADINASAAIAGTKLTGVGKVLQVITATDATSRSSSSTSFATASNTLSVSITPSSASNKIFIIVHSTGYATGAGQMPIIMTYLDSPSSTSALTYQVYGRTSGASEYKTIFTIYRGATNLAGGTTGFVELGAGNGTFYLQNDSHIGSITCFEIAG
jgi:hypothetical protein